MPTAHRSGSFVPDSTDGILDEIRVLEKRLRDGEEFLRHGRGSSHDTENFERWESAWIGLLEQYERLCDQVGQIADEAQVQPRGG